MILFGSPGRVNVVAISRRAAPEQSIKRDRARLWRREEISLGPFLHEPECVYDISGFVRVRRIEVFGAGRAFVETAEGERGRSRPGLQIRRDPLRRKAVDGSVVGERVEVVGRR